MLVLTALVVSGLVAEVEGAEKISPEMKRAESRTAEESAVREKMLKTIDPYIREATLLLEKKKFKDARAQCDTALNKLNAMNLGSGPSVISQKSMVLQLRTEILRHWGDNLLRHAKADLDVAYRTGNKDSKLTLSKLQSAMALADRIRMEVPEYMKQANLVTDKAQKIQKSLAFESETALVQLDPDNSSRKEKIAIQLRQADVYYKNTLYSKARDILEQILIDDPYNEKAISMLRRIYRKLYSVAATRRENEILESMNQIEWKWSNAVLPKGDQLYEDHGPKITDSEDNAKLYEKLQAIIIPEVDFSGISISSVIKQLEQLARENDNDPEKKGINIFYSQQEGAAANQEVSMNLEKMPIGTLIDYLCLMTGLKYRVENNAIIIGSDNLNSMTTRYFKMRITTYNNISQYYGGVISAAAAAAAGNTASLTDTGGGEGGGFLSVKSDNAPASVLGATNEQLESYFKESGVPFPAGSSVSYDRDSGVLTATNTLDNLQKLEMALKESEAASQMILIESKFLEIRAIDLEELGFEWTLTHNNSNPAWMTGAENSTSGMIDYGSAAISQTLQRFYGGASNIAASSSSDFTDQLINNMSVLPNFGPSGAYNVFLTVHAIDQTSRGETLSAPKVIATASLPATIKMVEEYSFPSAWSAATVTSNNNTFQYKPSVPSGFKKENIGTELTVTPYLSPYNETIMLQLLPKIRSHDDANDWDIYDYQLVIGDITGGNTTGNTTTFYPTIKMPRIYERSVDTMLKLYDGETIVLGGILEDKLYQIDDRFPFLGDLPLLGRLFSTQLRREERNNLMVFVTARIMKLDGLPVNQKTENGLFYFNR